ncbi:MAG: hypothetical protein MRZ79_17460 [Bacteroidia bacterium]|nr:hypothetical protein [Bacteroidia bacterium]
MNFVAHYYIDSHLDNGLFVVGVSTPDLVPVFHPKYRLRSRLVKNALTSPHSEKFSFFAKGVLRHFEADEIFHSAPFFHFENKQLIELIGEYYPDGEVKRAFFVAHILFELVLDRVLVLNDPLVLDAYYKHWENEDLEEVTQMTARLFGESANGFEGYQGYLNRFASRKYLYGFREWDELIYVFRRIMERVGIDGLGYIAGSRFRDLLSAYESLLIPRVPAYIKEMRDKLSHSPLS